MLQWMGVYGDWEGMEKLTCGVVEWENEVGQRLVSFCGWAISKDGLGGVLAQGRQGESELRFGRT